ncbi:MAG: LON peptidase substrate-binding domain-containing protein [Cocleimonas sp.]|nr:LON peptidase substrate-binding domain-containing protein [Cocleimonas sp.]
MPVELILFPANSVLYPGGATTVQIIEPRDLSMVSDCTRNEKPFIALSHSDNTKNKDSRSFNEIGTLAYIVDFNMPSAGVLEIICRGREMARLIRYRARPDGLIIAQVEPLPLLEIFRLPRKYEVLKDVLRSYIEREGMGRYKEELEEDWDNPDWLGCRLSEILPIDRQQHYALLIMKPLERLFHIKKLLKK